MAKIHTHYDNLKVARNAPPEVIRAAYRTLSQRFHPDRNAGDEAATRIFQIINNAYDVLSDPAKRKEHDEWIAKTEAEELETRFNNTASAMQAEQAAYAGGFSKYSSARYEKTASSLAVAFKGLTVKQRNFILFFSGLILAIIAFIILIG